MSTWKLNQSLGERESISKQDHISVLSSNVKGNYLSVGDRNGRIILLEKINSEIQNNSRLDFCYTTEFQAHEEHFDWSRNQEVIGEVQQICWINNFGNNFYFLSCSMNQIRFWKLKNKLKKTVTFQQKSKAERTQLFQRMDLYQAYSPFIFCEYSATH